MLTDYRWKARQVSPPTSHRPTGGLVYDVGMYDGADTAYYLAEGYRVVAIEAHPELVAAARRRFARELADGLLVILNVAVADGWGTHDLWISDDHLEWSSLEPEELFNRGVEPRAITVECRPFASILEEYGTPYFVKIDVERSDVHVLKALDRACLPQYCSVELGYDRTGGTDLELFLTAIDMEFSAFKIIAQADFSSLEFQPYAIGPAIRRRIPVGWKPLNLLEYRRGELVERIRWALVRTPGTLGAFDAVSARVARRTRRDAGGRPANHHHVPGSSGPFGEDTPGPWMTAEEAIFTWLAFRLRHTRVPHRTNAWHDLHCRR